MKKSVLFTALASVVLVGCVSEEVTDLGEKSKAKIAFDAPVMYNPENETLYIYKTKRLI